jgi:hypothetical protein
MVLRMTKFITLADTSQEGRTGFTVFGGDIFSWGSCGIGKYSTSCDAFVDMAIPDSGSAGVNDVWTNGKYLFGAVDGDPIYYCSSKATAYAASDWTGAGNDTATSVDYKWLHHHAGFLYAGKDLSSSNDFGNEVYFADDIDLGDLFGESSDDPDVMLAGIDGYGTIGAESIHEDLVILRPDGVYKMEPDKSACKPAIEYKDLVSTDNFLGHAIYNENLVYSIRDSIYQWNGFAVSNITPRALGDTFPYKSYGSFSNFVPVGKWMYALANDNTTYPSLDLLCFDGVNWFKLMSVYQGDSDNATGAVGNGMSYDVINDRLWVSYTSSEYITGYVPCSTRSQFPFADFSTDGDHYLETSKQHAGFRMNAKSTPSILIEADNLSTDVYLEVEYKGDTDTVWRPWGGSSGETNIITEDGLTELVRPTGHTAETLSYYYMQYRIYFRTNTSDQTPRMTSFIPRVLMRPKTLWGWDMTIAAMTDGVHGQNLDKRSAYQIEQDLKTARNSVQPIEFYDIYGDLYYVSLTAVTPTAVEFHGDEGAQPDIEQMINISMVELG